MHAPNPLIACPHALAMRSFVALFVSPSRDWSLLKAVVLGTNQVLVLGLLPPDCILQ